MRREDRWETTKNANASMKGRPAARRKSDTGLRPIFIAGS